MLPPKISSLKKQKIVHNRKFVKRYASIVYWRGVWLAIFYSFIGFITSISITLPLFSYKFELAGDVAEYPLITDKAEYLKSIYNDIGITNEAFIVFVYYIVKFILFTDFLFYAPFVGIPIGLIIARFKFYQLLAEAEILIVLSEIADSKNFNNSGMSSTHVTGRFWLQRTIIFIIPFLILSVWYYGYTSLYQAIESPKIQGIYKTSSPNNIVIEFDYPLASFSSLELQATYIDKSSNKAKTLKVLTLDKNNDMFKSCKGNTILLGFLNAGHRVNLAPENEQAKVIEEPEYKKGFPTTITLSEFIEVESFTIKTTIYGQNKISTFEKALGANNKYAHYDPEIAIYPPEIDGSLFDNLCTDFYK